MLLRQVEDKIVPRVINITRKLSNLQLNVGIVVRGTYQKFAALEIADALYAIKSVIKKQSAEPEKVCGQSQRSVITSSKASI